MIALIRQLLEASTKNTHVVAAESFFFSLVAPSSSSYGVPAGHRRVLATCLYLSRPTSSSSSLSVWSGCFISGDAPEIRRERRPGVGAAERGGGGFGGREKT